MIELGGVTITFSQAAPDFSIWVWLGDKVLGSLVSGLGLAIVGGWWFARVNEKYRSRRDHYSRTADALKANLDALVAAATKYWTTDKIKDRASLGPEISYRTGEVNTLVQLCAAIFWKSPDAPGPNLTAELVITALPDGQPPSALDSARAEKVAELASQLSSLVAHARIEFFEGQQSRVRIPWSLLLSVICVILTAPGM